MALIARTYKEVLQISNKKTATSMENWSKEMNKQTAKANKHMKVTSELL